MDKDKKEMLERITKMEAELEQMRQLANKESNPKPWKPIKGETWYFITGKSGALSSQSTYDFEKANQIGNAFKTKEEAEKQIRIRKAKKRVLDLILELNEGWTPRWKDTDYKYCVTFDFSFKKFVSSHSMYYTGRPDSHYLKNLDVFNSLISRAGADIYALFDMEKEDFKKV